MQRICAVLARLLRMPRLIGHVYVCFDLRRLTYLSYLIVLAAGGSSSPPHPYCHHQYQLIDSIHDDNGT